jgi:molybdenum cofactor cytidylyltransferase
MKIAAIILAAGASTRMTGYKQLLRYKNTSLLKLLYNQLQELSLYSITCVTGALHKELIDLLEAKNVTFVQNKEYEKGMLSSIQVGLKKVLEHSQPDAILICLSDQPLIPLSHYKQLTTSEKHTKKHIISSSYNETFGPPVLIKSVHFEELLSLQGKSAKPFIEAHKKDAELITCEEAGTDIDTDKDYEQLIEANG